ncbi:hypothetical protein CEXT_456331, partial [Caerostris extrusa]
MGPGKAFGGACNTLQLHENSDSE